MKNGYARVSADSQGLATQVRQLRADTCEKVKSAASRGEFASDEQMRAAWARHVL
jgi:DNA invertase Pin-like site-specific DNA recombinase